jgi:hypothetical protein
MRCGLCGKEFVFGEKRYDLDGCDICEECKKKREKWKEVINAEQNIRYEM